MTELTIRPDEIREALDRYISSYQAETKAEEVGRVTETGDGIARVEGLPSCMANELLRLPDGLSMLGMAAIVASGVALVLHERRMGAALSRAR